MEYQSKLTVKYQGLAEVNDIADRWKSLEQHRSSFFLSWKWMDAWLHSLDTTSNVYVLQFLNPDKKIVGIAFAVSTRVIRRIFFPVNVITLNETLDNNTNYIIEYNNILHDPDYRRDVYFSFFDFFSQNHELFDEIQISALDDKNTEDLLVYTARFSLRHILERLEHVNFIDLTRHKNSTKEIYLDRLSTNKRSQIRRSLKYFDGYGEANFNTANDKIQALTFFHEMEDLHQVYWESKNEHGSFANPNWVRFHEYLIENYFDNIFIAKISYGSHLLGYLYNIVDNNIILSMQSGFNYLPKDNNNRPGIVSHLLATEFYIANNFYAYNFLAGTNRYKQELSNTFDMMSWRTIQNPHRVKLKIENALLWLYHLITNKSHHDPENIAQP